MANALHHAVVPLRGNERSALDQGETATQILPMPSEETCDWLRAMHRAFCEECTRRKSSHCEAAAAAHNEAITCLLSIFGKICETDHSTAQNPKIIQPLPASCFVAGGTIHRPASNLSWNEPSPEKRRKRP